MKTQAASLAGSEHRRATPVSSRLDQQQKHLNLPILPTTTIGSFPQTPELRRVRREVKSKKISEEDYDKAIKAEIDSVVKLQEELDIDVLVHGEPERNDMVEYFGEQLDGFCFSANGWVQSYGSRCVKPPIIFGDVSRPKAMTVYWSTYAQSVTKRPLKGMLTGPETILNCPFGRNDQPQIRDVLPDLTGLKGGGGGFREGQHSGGSKSTRLPSGKVWHCGSPNHANYFRVGGFRVFRITTWGV